MTDFNPVYYRKIAECTQLAASTSNLSSIAKAVQLEENDLEKLFKKWGTDDVQSFLNYVNSGYLQNVITFNDQPGLFDQDPRTGKQPEDNLDMPKIKIIPLDEGDALQINYSFQDSPFGRMMIATTARGICYLSYSEDEKKATDHLKKILPMATLVNAEDPIQKKALKYFEGDWQNIDEIPLHLKGTDFQMKVWNALLQIPFGKLCTYHYIANLIGNPKASRAAGTAIGSNNVAYFVPCHRAIQSSGHLGKYKWDSPRKAVIIGWEHQMLKKIQLQNQQNKMPATL